ncbi:VanZ family protein [Nocardioides zeae]|uniref:VanZ family protein n=1 Tax=Nocardioides zeae TaxID=1457234 RepID=A0A6P0HF05_9ACTN|nr:VanZ family protein [Nocardioides zeae]
MITTILVEHPWLSPTALALLVVLGPLVGRLVAGRPAAAWLLTGLATVPVVVLTMLPTDRRAFERCEVAWTLPTVGRVELAANVVLFVAPVLFAVVATRRPLVVAGAASALSAAIETVQALVPAIGRSCSTNDWLSNTIGVVVGVVLGVVALRLAGPVGRERLTIRPRSLTRS